MAVKSFKLSYYKAILGSTISASMSGTHFNANGMIKVIGKSESGETGEFLIYFLAPGSPVPKPPAFTKTNCAYGGMCVPMDQFPYYIDLLRNEKPMLVELFCDDPEGNHIRTHAEPVGIEDDDNHVIPG